MRDQIFFSSAFLFSMGCVIVSFLLAVALIPALRRIAPQIGLVDRPGGRKQHDGAVPLVGGVGISLAVVVTSLAVGFDWFQLWYLAVAWVALLSTGIWDDRRAVRSTVKFAIQIAVALLVVVGEAETIRRVAHTVFGSGLMWRVVAYTIALLFVVGFINAFNMVDGVDGLAGSLALTMSGAFLLVAGDGISGIDTNTLLLATVGAVCGFLIFNSRSPLQNQRHRVFLGDAGSMALGVLLAWYAIHLAGTPSLEPRGPGVVAWIVAYPVSDTVSVMLLRLVQGRHPFTPDRQHLHHLLLARGLSVNATLAVINGLSWLGIGYAFFGNALGFSGLALVATICVLMAAHFVLVLWLSRQPENEVESEVTH